MKYEELVATVGDLPLFRGSLLLSGDRDPAHVRRQLARWTAAGKVVQLRRNVYVLAAPWRRVEPHPFVVANELHGPSYVSLQSALAYHGMIPEAVPVTTSVTTARPADFRTVLGRYTFRHVRADAFFGYSRARVLENQAALLADPAKALLDLIYLTPGGDAEQHLRSLRLWDWDALDDKALHEHAHRWGKKKIHRAVDAILRIRESADEPERER